MIRLIKNKKPIQICIGFLFLLQYAHGQDQLAYSRALYQNKALEKARESIDSFVHIHPDDANGWQLKAVIYNAISKDPQTANLLADARMEAFQALKRAGSLQNQASDSLGRNIALDLYNGYTNDGLVAFNTAAAQNNTATFIRALGNFKNAGLIGRYIYSNNWSRNDIDTLNLYYTSKSAIYADKEEDAVFYSKIIIDKNITRFKQQDEFEPIYQWLAYYYKIKSDSLNFNYYNKKGLKTYPASDYFSLLYADWYRQQKDYPNLFKQYAHILSSNKGRKQYMMAYYQDLYNHVYESKAAPAERALYQSRLFKGLTAYLKQNPHNLSANLLMGKYYINQAVQTAAEMAMRSTTDPAIMAAYKSRVALNYKKSNYYLLAGIQNKTIPTNKNYHETLELLIANFIMLDMPKEVRKYQQIMASLPLPDVSN